MLFLEGLPPAVPRAEPGAAVVAHAGDAPGVEAGRWKRAIRAWVRAGGTEGALT
jgi:hypothetical protein